MLKIKDYLADLNSVQINRKTSGKYVELSVRGDQLKIDEVRLYIEDNREDVQSVCVRESFYSLKGEDGYEIVYADCGAFLNFIRSNFTLDDLALFLSTLVTHHNSPRICRAFLDMLSLYKKEG